MRYRVRTPEGELGYASLAELRRAYAQGLVGPQDEVAPEDGGAWQRAGGLPELREAGRPEGPARGAQALAIALPVGLGALALFLLFQEGWRSRLIGLALALVVSSLLTRVTMRAFRRGRPPA